MKSIVLLSAMAFPDEAAMVAKQQAGVLNGSDCPNCHRSLQPGLQAGRTLKCRALLPRIDGAHNAGAFERGDSRTIACMHSDNQFLLNF